MGSVRVNPFFYKQPQLLFYEVWYPVKLVCRETNGRKTQKYDDNPVQTPGKFSWLMP